MKRAGCWHEDLDGRNSRSRRAPRADREVNHGAVERMLDDRVANQVRKHFGQRAVLVEQPPAMLIDQRDPTADAAAPGVPGRGQRGSTRDRIHPRD